MLLHLFDLRFLEFFKDSVSIMNEILNGKYKKLKNDPIGKGSQADVYLFEDMISKKK